VPPPSAEPSTPSVAPPPASSPAAGRWKLVLHAMHPARWGALILAVVLMVLWATTWLGAAGPGPVLILEQAQAQAMQWSSGQLYPPAQAVKLPYVQERNLPDGTGVRLQLHFNLPAGWVDPNHLLGAYAAQLCGGARISLNGQRIHERGHLGEADASNCLEPLITPLPAAMLRPGNNLLEIDLAAHGLPGVVARAHAGQLSALRIGDFKRLELQAHHQLLLQVSATQALATVVACIGLAALALSAVSQLPYLGYFGTACLGWTLICALLLGADLPLPLPLHWSQWLLSIMVAPVAVSGMLFLLRYCGLRVAGIELTLVLQCLVVPLSLLLAGPDRLHQVAPPWFAIVSLELLIALGVFLQRAWKLSRHDFWVGSSSFMAFLVCLLGEFLLAEGPVLLPGKLAVSVALIVMFAGMVWRMHQLFQNALISAEQARIEAERRVLEVQANMEQNYGQMAELRVEQVTARERKRIAADLHDDLGAKLLTIVHTSESERIATLAREALEEMRLSVRGLSGRAVQLGDAIGDWRSEVMSRLSQGGVELAWNTPDELLMSERALSARAYVQTTRILREAVSNVLKHSGGTHCEISIRQEVNDFEIIIADNGRGIPMELDGKLDRGHGMSTMKGRAKQLQGQCLVESGPGYGTTIRLTLPL
jgi:two-component system sensor histidine kinase UhpB